MRSLRHTTSVLTLLACSLLAVRAAGAQGTVRGVVHDSTHAMDIAGAEVFVLDGSLRAITDSTGAFVVHDVPFGRRTIVVLHPRLDSLGLDGLEVTVDLDSASPTAVVDIATPSGNTFYQRICGRAPADDEALLIGRAGTLDGRPLDGATVSIDWVEMRIRPGEMTRTPRTITATTDGFGAFRGCGVPRVGETSVDSAGWTTVVHELRVAAQAPAMATGSLILFPNAERIQRLDLVLGGENDAARTSVRGRVVTETGEPIERGRVILSGDSTVTADVDADGAFMLDGLRLRTEQLYVRAVGFVPMWIEIVATDSILNIGDVTLGRISQRLETMIVTADWLSRQRQEFEERRRMGLGTFLDEEDIASYPELTAAILYMRVPRSALVQGGPGIPSRFGLKRISMMGSGSCIPRWFVDGYEMPGLTATESNFMLADAIRVEVYRAAFAPPKYADFNGCGAVVIWTR